MGQCPSRFQGVFANNSVANFPKSLNKNEMVCNLIRKSMPCGTTPTFDELTSLGGGCDIPATEHRGITLNQLQAVYENIKRRCVTEQWGLRPDFQDKDTNGEPKYKWTQIKSEQVTLYDAANYVILLATEEKKTSLVELIARDKQTPRRFVSHWWGEPVHHFILCLECHVKDWQPMACFADRDPERFARDPVYLNGDSPFWVCAYANNQWQLAGDVPEDPANSSFKKAMDLAEATVSILDIGGKVFTRVWCSYEIYISLTKKNYQWHVYTAIGEHTWMDSSRSAVGIVDGVSAPRYRQSRDNFERQEKFPMPLLEDALKVCLEEAEASREADRVHILNSIAESEDLNAPPPLQHPTYKTVNETLRGRIAAGVVTATLKYGNFKMFAPALKRARLQTLMLDLGIDELTLDDARLLGSSVPACLQRLQLGSYTGDFKSPENGCGLAEGLAEAFQQRQMASLNEFIIGCKIGDDGVAALAKAFQKTALPSLQELHMSKNNIGDDGAKALAQALKATPSLTKLILFTNKIGDGGATALAQAFMENATPSLECLCLYGNQIGDDSAKALAQAIKMRATPRLGRLELNSNEIGDTGASALADAFKPVSVPNLDLAMDHGMLKGWGTKLSLANNKIGNAGAAAVADAAEARAFPKLFRIQLHGNERVTDKDGIKERLQNAMPDCRYIDV